ncbi:hypothetical protein FRC00_007521 [Tulasnella sp. 408]|nr:hypothetical protein FRC00_007521 [Tulasnella sp. 408]
MFKPKVASFQFKIPLKVFLYVSYKIRNFKTRLIPFRHSSPFGGRWKLPPTSAPIRHCFLSTDSA